MATSGCQSRPGPRAAGARPPLRAKWPQPRVRRPPRPGPCPFLAAFPLALGARGRGRLGRLGERLLVDHFQCRLRYHETTAMAPISRLTPTMVRVSGPSQAGRPAGSGGAGGAGLSPGSPGGGAAPPPDAADGGTPRAQHRHGVEQRWRRRARGDGEAQRSEQLLGLPAQLAAQARPISSRTAGSNAGRGVPCPGSSNASTKARWHRPPRRRSGPSPRSPSSRARSRGRPRRRTR